MRTSLHTLQRYLHLMWVFSAGWGGLSPATVGWAQDQVPASTSTPLCCCYAWEHGQGYHYIWAPERGGGRCGPTPGDSAGACTAPDRC